ncbi:biotin synthase BioB [Legionella dresdenensis]|uniref:Biotin synthase n=1 Tax=Legionella dresdenensis TaxID=450200 RepID=A0ABV8CC67_9GAMM
METAKKYWQFSEVNKIYTQPLHDLLYEAHTVHKANHPANTIKIAQLLSIKTGACPEDCGYCSQSGHHNTIIEKHKLMDVDTVLEHARQAKANGAKRFCMGAAWRNPPEKEMPKLKQMIHEVKALGLETCMTLGMLTGEQAHELKDAGLDYYNHNIDTSPSYYNKVVTTRTFDDRLDTIKKVSEAGMQVCCGGILGLGETQNDRVEFVMTLANMEPQPLSVPINQLVRFEGTPLAHKERIDNFEIVRTIATARILLPQSFIRLTAGRIDMSEELQALCFFAGANSVFTADKMLTCDSINQKEKDDVLFTKLGLNALPA